jgi:asparagine synthase (glutamine-hydrolysing)
MPLGSALDRSGSSRVVRSEGRDLIDSYWGSYVAIVREDATSRTWIIRSPVGALPCLHTRYQDVDIYFSSILDGIGCGLLSFTVNWRYVARHLAKLSQSGETGLNEISEVRSGECVDLDRTRNERRTHAYWNPLDAAREQAISDPARAVALVRSTVRNCVQSWASCHDTIVHQLSGGLDSSIVLSCLHDAPTNPRVICVNRYSLRSDSDEREYARLAARHVNRELIELHRDSDFRLEDILDARPAEKPQDYLAQLGLTLPEARFAVAQGATGVFSGTYGDQLFYGTAYDLTPADYIHDHGLGQGLLPVVLSAARASHKSIWTVLRGATLKGLLRHRWDPISTARPVNRLLREDTIRSLIGPISATHPWYEPQRYVPPGKQLHIFGLMNSHGFYLSFDDLDDLYYTSPLLSQPLVELCLRIPTYVLCHNGWGREIERRAFAADIPTQIARRRSKGGQADFTAEVAKRNHVLIREVLLNGALVANGLLDRAELEKSFAGRSSGLDKGPARMSKVLSMEVWLKSWSDSRLSAAA